MSRRTHPWLRPGLIGLHVLAVVTVVACILLGLWQLGVYDSRQEHQRAQSGSAPRVSLSSLWGHNDPFEDRLSHRSVSFEGRFAQADQQVWVTGKRQGDRSGVWLVAPVIVKDGAAALLVVRGWAPAVSSFPAVPSGLVTLDAVLEPSEVGGSAFDPSGRTIGAVRIPALTNELPFDLYSGYAISSSSVASGGLERVTPPGGDVSWTTGLRNLAYAFQWWIFGAFAIFMWWRMATESVAASRSKVA